MNRLHSGSPTIECGRLARGREPPGLGQVVAAVQAAHVDRARLVSSVDGMSEVLAIVR